MKFIAASQDKLDTKIAPMFTVTTMSEYMKFDSVIHRLRNAAETCVKSAEEIKLRTRSIDSDDDRIIDADYKFVSTLRRDTREDIQYLYRGQDGFIYAIHPNI